jgi:hypothetical protein
MMFAKRRRAQGLIAQSLYEPLDESDRAELDRLLERLPDLKDDIQRLRRVVDSIPVDDPRFDADLRPVVLSSLAAGPRQGARALPQWAPALAAFLVVALGVAYWIAMHPPAAVAPGTVVSQNPESPLTAAMDEADGLIDSRDYPKAYVLLAQAVDRAPGDEAAGRACQLMADLAFEELQWYPEAFAAYDALRHRYVDQFRAVPANFERLNLLDETRGSDDRFASLRALDVARQDGSFDTLEDIAARHPATYLASAASAGMARLVAADQGFDPDTGRIRAMRLALLRSRNPVAREQIKLEIAHLLATSPDDSARARELYEEIANGSITTLAEAARKSLANIDETDAASPRL